MFEIDKRKGEFLLRGHGCSVWLVVAVASSGLASLEGTTCPRTGAAEQGV